MGIFSKNYDDSGIFFGYGGSETNTADPNLNPEIKVIKNSIHIDSSKFDDPTYLQKLFVDLMDLDKSGVSKTTNNPDNLLANQPVLINVLKDGSLRFKESKIFEVNEEKYSYTTSYIFFNEYAEQIFKHISKPEAIENNKETIKTILPYIYNYTDTRTLETNHFMRTFRPKAKEFYNNLVTRTDISKESASDLIQEIWNIEPELLNKIDIDRYFQIKANLSDDLRYSLLENIYTKTSIEYNNKRCALSHSSKNYIDKLEQDILSTKKEYFDLTGENIEDFDKCTTDFLFNRALKTKKIPNFTSFADKAMPLIKKKDPSVDYVIDILPRLTFNKIDSSTHEIKLDFQSSMEKFISTLLDEGFYKDSSNPTMMYRLYRQNLATEEQKEALKALCAPVSNSNLPHCYEEALSIKIKELFSSKGEPWGDLKTLSKNVRSSFSRKETLNLAKNIKEKSFYFSPNEKEEAKSEILQELILNLNGIRPEIASIVCSFNIDYSCVNLSEYSTIEFNLLKKNLLPEQKQMLSQRGLNIDNHKYSKKQINEIVCKYYNNCAEFTNNTNYPWYKQTKEMFQEICQTGAYTPDDFLEASKNMSPLGKISGMFEHKVDDSILKKEVSSYFAKSSSDSFDEKLVEYCKENNLKVLPPAFIHNENKYDLASIARIDETFEVSARFGTVKTTLLNEACKKDSKERILLLLNNGADIYKKCDFANGDFQAFPIPMMFRRKLKQGDTGIEQIDKLMTYLAENIEPHANEKIDDIIKSLGFKLKEDSKIKPIILKTKKIMHSMHQDTTAKIHANKEAFNKQKMQQNIHFHKRGGLGE